MSMLSGRCTSYTSSISNIVAMSFGWFVPSSSAGTIQLKSDGTLGTVTGVTIVPSHPPVAASFTLTSNSSQTQVYINETSITLTGPSTMTLDSWVLSTNTTKASPEYTGTVPVSVKLGATLHISANQAAGSYTGSFTIVTYPQ